MSISPLNRAAMLVQPRMNKELTEGLAYHHSYKIEGVVDRILKCASVSFPQGIAYVGCRRATPEEQFLDEVRPKQGKHTHEIAYSDVYHVRYNFEYTDRYGVVHELRPRYLRLPYFLKGGIFRIRGTALVASPVLSDGIMSLESDRVFVPFTRVRLVFQQTNHSIKINGLPSYVPVVFSKIHKGALKKGKMLSMVMHYLMAINGVTDTFKKFFDCDIITTTNDELDQYPEEDYTRFQTTGINPMGRTKAVYKPTNVAFVVKNEQNTHAVQKAIAGMFYVIDRVSEVITVQEIDNPRLWRRMLMAFVKTRIITDLKALEEMNNHLASVESYMDDIVKERLQVYNIPSQSISHLFAYIVKNHSILIATASPNDVSNKHIEVIQPLLFDIIEMISNNMFQLQRSAAKPNGLTPQIINSTLDKSFKTETIMSASKSGMITQLDTATDCLPLGVTRTLVPQSKAAKDSGSLVVGNLLHSSMTIYCCYLAITKSMTSPTGSINHFVKLDRFGKAIVDENRKRRLAYAQSRLDVS